MGSTDTASRFHHPSACIKGFRWEMCQRCRSPSKDWLPGVRVRPSGLYSAVDAWILGVNQSLLIAQASDRHNSIAVRLLPSTVGILRHRDAELLFIEFLYQPLTNPQQAREACSGCKMHMRDGHADVQVMCSLSVAQSMFVVEPDLPIEPSAHRFLHILEE